MQLPASEVRVYGMERSQKADKFKQAYIPNVSGLTHCTLYFSHVYSNVKLCVHMYIISVI